MTIVYNGDNNEGGDKTEQHKYGEGYTEKYSIYV